MKSGTAILTKFLKLISKSQLNGKPGFGTPVVYWVGVVIYRLWFHPLKTFPGPKLYAAWGMPFLYQNLVKGTFGPSVAELHRKYGPIVRIAPNRLAVDASVAWPDVFTVKSGKGHQEFGKLSGFFGPDGDKSLVGSPTREAHRRQRRQLSHGFSETAVYEQEPIITFYIDPFIRRLSENAGGGNKSIDILRWLNYLTFDIIGDLALGESFGSLESSKYHPWVHNIFHSIRGLSLARFFGQSGPLLAPLALLDSGGALKAFSDNRKYAFEKAIARMDLGVEPVTRNKVAGADGQFKVQVRRDFITYMMRKTRDGEDGLTTTEICKNAESIILAGSETTGTNLSTLFFQLARPCNRHYRDAVYAEVRSQFKREADVTLRTVQSNHLPLLHACIEESLRIHPPAGEMPWRVSPGGLVGGNYVPPGTYLIVYPYAATNNPDNFLEATSWKLERFLAEDHLMYSLRFKAYDNMAVFKPFSAGPRDCIGKNLAYFEMRLVAARVLLRFDIELGESQSERWLDEQRVFTVWEKAPLMLRLKERTDLELKGK
ncbi:hypothetical protein RB600_003600 [Gaeumannomyces tritici]